MGMYYRWLRRSVRSRSALRGEQGVGNDRKAMDDLAERSGVTWGDATPPASARRRIVIVGAGFGGLSAAQRLARVAADIIVIDRRNHHLFQPLLYQVATAALSPADIASPIRGILSRQPNTVVILGTVTASIWPAAQCCSATAAFHMTT